MSIEFRCSKCDRLLRTPDGTSGKDAKCPQCGTIVRIPEVATPPTAPPQAPVPPPQRAPVPPGLRDTLALGETPNPYQSPTAGEMRAGAAGPARRGFEPTRIDLGEVLSRTWELYKGNLGVCVLGTLIMMFGAVTANIVLYIASSAIFGQADRAAMFGAWLVQQLAGQAIGAFFAIGLIMFMLRIARAESADFSALFGAGPFFLFGVAIQLITTLAVALGLILLIIPGIILGLMFSQNSLKDFTEQNLEYFG